MVAEKVGVQFRPPEVPDRAGARFSRWCIHNEDFIRVSQLLPPRTSTHTNYVLVT